MDFVGMLQGYFVVPIIVVCVIVGYCIKHIPALAKVSNDYIPAISSVLGVVLALLLAIGTYTDVPGAITVGIGGLVSGWAATGLHQVAKKFIDGLGGNKEA